MVESHTLNARGEYRNRSGNALLVNDS